MLVNDNVYYFAPDNTPIIANDPTVNLMICSLFYLYSNTVMFPGSTYTPGGPSTTHSDPSSNLDLDNCYKPINVDEDDDGGDGNSGHDVGYDGSSSEFDDASDDDE